MWMKWAYNISSMCSSISLCREHSGRSLTSKKLILPKKGKKINGKYLNVKMFNPLRNKISRFFGSKKTPIHSRSCATPWHSPPTGSCRRFPARRSLTWFCDIFLQEKPSFLAPRIGDKPRELPLQQIRQVLEFRLPLTKSWPTINNWRCRS